MSIPFKFLEKMGIYDIKMNGVDVKATVLDDDLLVTRNMSEIKSLARDLSVVGVDVKKSQSGYGVLLLIYAAERCLIIQLGRMSNFPIELSSFLADDSICFVGFKMEDLKNALRRSKFERDKNAGSWLSSGVEIRDLAARVLKSPALQTCACLEELASKTGTNFTQLPSEKSVASLSPPPDWDALCFSTEEVKYALQNAHLSYEIGKTVLSTLG